MYRLKIQIDGLPGWFVYEVKTREQAMIHFSAITANGYRRINDRAQFEWWGPSTINHIIIEGEGLETEYPDTLVRT